MLNNAKSVEYEKINQKTQYILCIINELKKHGTISCEKH